MRAGIVQAFLGWWLVGTLVIITAIDIIAITSGNPDETVSRWFFDLGRVHPWVYLLVGITLGHILFPLLVTNGRDH